jgi:tetratricopeptide (TPR) repeat protein
VYREGILNEKIGIIRIQDKMVANIIKWVDWKRPIYFAVTVAEENKIGLEDFLPMEGMVYKLVNTKATQGQFHLNTAVLEKNMFEKYQYHELSDSTVYKPPNTLKLVTNYFIGFAQLAERYAYAGEKEKAVLAAWGAIKKTPNDLNKRFILYKIFAARDFNEELKPFLDWELASPEFFSDRNGTQDDRLSIYSLVNIVGEKARSDSLVQAEMQRSKLDSFEKQYVFGTKLLQYSLDEQAIAFFKKLVAENPNNTELLEAMIASLYTTGRYEEALEAVDKILQIKPDDTKYQKTKELLMKLIQEEKAKKSPKAPQ